MIVLVKTDLDKNSNKFWKAWTSGTSFHVHNGRVGTKGQLQIPIVRSTELGAKLEMERKLKSKLKSGYRELQVINTNAGMKTDVMINDIIRQAASEQIQTNNKSVVLKLIDELIEKNIHNIVSNTEIEFDEELGLFKTPVGFIGERFIDLAEDRLNEILPLIKKGDFNSERVKDLFCDYLMLIPQKCKSKLAIETFFGTEEATEKQFNLVADLRSSVQQLDQIKEQMEANTDRTVPDIFNLSLNLVTDESIIGEVVKRYENHKSSYHSSATKRVKRVFEVNINHMSKGFEENKMHEQKNVWTLWHGTRAGNVISILKNGLNVPPKNAGHVTARMFGNGLYFSNHSSKALNYSSGFWAGKKEYLCYMFLCDVAMGDYFVPTGADSDLHNQGYDSVFAQANISQVKNNEMIVYDLNRVRPKYLVEFS